LADSRKSADHPKNLRSINIEGQEHSNISIVQLVNDGITAPLDYMQTGCNAHLKKCKTFSTSGIWTPPPDPHFGA